MGRPAPDPDDLLEQLKAQHQELRWAPLAPHEPRRPKETDFSRSKQSLDYLHANWAIPDTFDPAASGGGARGKVLSLFGRMTYRVLGPYFRQERDLLSHLVRLNEALVQRCDDLALRYQQLSEDVLDRQVDEAANLTELALWLHLDPPASVEAQVNGTSPARAEGAASSGGDRSAQ